MTNFSITSAAVELGVSKETVRRRLAEIGVKTGKGETFTLRELFKAMSGDPRLELTRLRRAQADAEERKNRIAEGELIAIEEATQIYRQEIAGNLPAARRATVFAGLAACRRKRPGKVPSDSRGIQRSNEGFGA